MGFMELLISSELAKDIDPVAGFGVIVFTAVALGAIIMQFLTLVRHEGEQAVVSSMTWLLLASFSVAMGAYIWREYSDYFLVLLMGLLAAGAIAGYMLTLSKREIIDRVRRTRRVTGGRRAEVQNAASSLRIKLRHARRVRHRQEM